MFWSTVAQLELVVQTAPLSANAGAAKVISTAAKSKAPLFNHEWFLPMMFSSFVSDPWGRVAEPLSLQRVFSGCCNIRRAMGAANSTLDIKIELRTLMRDGRRYRWTASEFFPPK